MIHATLHQLKVFEATARHGSFTRAAEELYLTQPTVSIQVKQLTKAVGLPLFEQIGKRLYLTQAGQKLLDTCQEIFDGLDQFEMAVSDLKGLKQGQLRLAVITTAKYFVPRLLGPFCQRFPGIDISLKVTNHQQLQERMATNDDDLYIISTPPEQPDLKIYPFLENPLVVLGPQDHPLVGKARSPISVLDGEQFIMREPGSGTRHAVQKLFAEHDVNVKVRLELGSNEAIKQAIAGGLGISVLSLHTIISEGTRGEFAILDVDHFPIDRHWYVAHLAGKQLSVVSQAFLNYLLEESHTLVEHLLPGINRAPAAIDPKGAELLTKV
ncbi:LysR family transcriptional regulator [Phormidium tenue]|uniref:LysR family transcriptional regulator n=1 Tax=Phormidium tenue NIES-30 TaxID=549789 RepID=A0A1U7J1H2_9CYAN|nr:LysR family transcriptional regulator [Phormidium tenue]MBD2233886.1 LysR family transcriptional regulator [Phormidium tenue FACHB-1052]OKH45678.1 LysR family transcriptional regulator [Phormidium tenue NIES-30]